MARFEVFGAVTVSFLEAEPGFVKKGTGKKHNSFFARTWLSTPTNTTTTTQKVFTTGRYAFHTHFMGGEEVLYRHVSSNQAIVVEMHHASADNDPRVSDDYASAVIPISRLTDSESISVSQWYQLYTRGHLDEPSSSIKLQLSFTREVATRAIAVEVPTRRTVATDGSSSSGSSSSSSSKSTRMDIEAEYAVADQRRRADTVTEDVPRREKKVQWPHEASPPPPPPTTLSVPPAESQHGRRDDGEMLAVGLCDYALLLGPAGTAALEAGGEVALWDQYPATDHPGLPLPPKVEFFAAPEGTQVVIAPQRPPPRMSSFILSGSGDADGMQQYGACLVFFVGVPYSGAGVGAGADAVSKSPRTPHSVGLATSGPEATGSDWWRARHGHAADPDADADADATNRQQMWAAVTLCILTRWPFLNQLEACLSTAYRRSIDTALQSWERSLGPAGSSEPSPPLRLGGLCADLLAGLCFSCPLPYSGAFSVTLQLEPPATRATQRAHPATATATATATAAAAAAVGVNFALPSPEDLPTCAYSIHECLFRRLGCRGALTVLGAALRESRILLVSTDLALLPAVGEAIRALLYPLRWTHVYLPVVPAPLLDLVQAPVPFLLGTHTDWLGMVPSETLQDVLVVDVDSGAISAGGVDVRNGGGGGSLVLPFPGAVDRWLTSCLQEIAGEEGTAVPRRSDDAGASTDTAIQLVVFHALLDCMRCVPGCLHAFRNDGGDEDCEVFNRPLLLSECSRSAEERDFLTILSETSAFQQFVAMLSRAPALSFFRRAWRALPVPSSREEECHFDAFGHRDDDVVAVADDDPRARFMPSPLLKLRGAAPSPTHRPMPVSTFAHGEEGITAVTVRGLIAQRSSWSDEIDANTPPSQAVALRATSKVQSTALARLLAHYSPLLLCARRAVAAGDSEEQEQQLQQQHRGTGAGGIGGSVVIRSDPALTIALHGRHSPAAVLSSERAFHPSGLDGGTRAKSPPRLQRAANNRWRLSTDTDSVAGRARTVTFEDLVQQFGSGATSTPIPGRQRAQTAVPAPKLVYQRDADGDLVARRIASMGRDVRAVSHDLATLQAVVAHRLAQRRSAAADAAADAAGAAGCVSPRVLLKGSPEERSRTVRQHIALERARSPSPGPGRGLGQGLRVDVHSPRQDDDAAYAAAATISAPSEGNAGSPIGFSARFDHEALKAASAAQVRWTLGALAGALQTPLGALVAKILPPQDDDAAPSSSTPLSSSSTTMTAGALSSSGRTPRGTLSRGRSVRFASPSKLGAAESQMQSWPPPSPYHAEGAADVHAPLAFLRAAFSGTTVGVGGRTHDDLLRRCAAALLAVPACRKALVQLLSHAPPHRPLPLCSGSSSGGGGTAPPASGRLLVPLDVSTFEALSRLLVAALEACVATGDFVVAHGLLRTSGRYFWVRRSKEGDSSSSSIDGAGVEFLSRRICQHPIFQNAELWTAVLQERLSTASAAAAEDTNGAADGRVDAPPAPPSASRKLFSLLRDGDTQHDRDHEASAATPAAPSKEAMAEAQALLRSMHALGVNHARATLFNRIVATKDLLRPAGAGAGDWAESVAGDLGAAVRQQQKAAAAMKNYLKLQRFIDALYSGNGKVDAAAYEDISPAQLALASLPSPTPAPAHTPSSLRTQTRPALATVTRPLSPMSPDSAVATAADESFAEEGLDSLVPLAHTRSQPGPRPRPGPGPENDAPLDLAVLYHSTARRDTSGAAAKDATAGAPVDGHAQAAVPPLPAGTGPGRRSMSQRLQGMFATGKHADRAASTAQNRPAAPEHRADEVARTLSTAAAEGAAEADAQAAALMSRGFHAVPLEGAAGSGRAVSLLAVGRFLLSGQRDGRICVSDVASGALLAYLDHCAVDGGRERPPPGGGGGGLFRRSSRGLPVDTPSTAAGAAAGVVTHLVRATPRDSSAAGATGFPPECEGVASGCSRGLVKLWAAKHVLASSRDASSDAAVSTPAAAARVDLVVALELHTGAPVSALALADLTPTLLGNERGGDRRDTRHVLDGRRWLVMSGDASGSASLTYVGVVVTYPPSQPAAAAPPPSTNGSASASASNAAERRRRGGQLLPPPGPLAHLAPPVAPAQLAAPQQRLQVTSRSVALRSHGAAPASHFALIRADNRDDHDVAAPAAAVRFVVVGTENGVVIVLDPSAQCLIVLQAHSSAVTGVVHFALPAASHSHGRDRNVIVTSGLNRRVILFEFREDAPSAVEDGRNNRYTVFKTNASVAAVSGVSAVRALVLGYADHRRSADGPITCVASHYSRADPRGVVALLASASAGGDVSLWDISLLDSDDDDGDGTERGGSAGVPARAILGGHTDRVTHLSWHERAVGAHLLLVSAALDGCVRVWVVSQASVGKGPPTGGVHTRCMHVWRLFGPASGGVLHLAVSLRSLTELDATPEDDGKKAAQKFMHPSATTPGDSINTPRTPVAQPTAFQDLLSAISTQGEVCAFSVSIMT